MEVYLLHFLCYTLSLWEWGKSSHFFWSLRITKFPKLGRYHLAIWLNHNARGDISRSNYIGKISLYSLFAVANDTKLGRVANIWG